MSEQIVCRVCDSADLAPRYVVRGQPMATCRNCGLVQLARHPSQEELAEIYGANYFPETKYALDPAARKEQQRRIDWLLRAGIAPRARVLDLGCATGDFMMSAREHFDMWGLDYSTAAIAVARKRMPEQADRLQSGAISTLDVPDGHFDAIAMWDVIEHLDLPQDALRAALPKLKPGGLIFLSSPNIGTAIAAILGPRWAFMTPPEHIALYSHATLRRLAERMGLKETRWMTRGKWINLAFLIYKLGRVFPELVPQALIRALQKGRIGKLMLYIPTGDIQYMAARKAG